MKILLLVLVLAAVALAKRKFSYKNYKVFRVHIKSEEQSALLAPFDGVPNFDFWSRLVMNGTVDIMVAPIVEEDFKEFLREHNIRNTIRINNVERAVQKERITQMFAPRTTHGRITFAKYHRYSDILAYVRGLESSHRNIVKVETIGGSSEGRDLVVVKISSGNSGGTKKTIFIDGGVHAREWIAPAQVLYIIQQLVENTDNRNMLKNTDWHIVPVVNPDGYEYTHYNHRLWRKTRSKGTTCYGTDANRNFGFHWGEIDASTNECSETYRGKSPFSEPETKAIRDLILRNPNIYKLYLTFHSYGQYILHPWGYTKEVPSNGETLTSLGESVSEAIRGVVGTRYKVGSSANVLYGSSGGSDDWAKGAANITLAYTIELPGGGIHGFDLPPNEISSVVKETFAGIKVFHNYVETNIVY